MAQVSARWKRIFLRTIFWSAKASGTPLETALFAAAQTQVETIKDGLILIGTSGNGASSSFQVPAGSPTPSDLVEFMGELVERYESARGILGSEAEDADIVSKMLAGIKSVRTFNHDFRGLRA